MKQVKKPELVSRLPLNMASSDNQVDYESGYRIIDSSSSAHILSDCLISSPQFNQGDTIWNNDKPSLC